MKAWITGNGLVGAVCAADGGCAEVDRATGWLRLVQAVVAMIKNTEQHRLLFTKEYTLS